MTTLDSLASSAPRPGIAGLRDRQPAAGQILAAGKTSIVVAPFAWGPPSPQLVTSPDDLDRRFAVGANATAGVYSDAYAAALVLLSRGRGPVVLSRVVSSGADAATIALPGDEDALSVTATAVQVGAAGNLYAVDIDENGAAVDVTVLFDGTIVRKVTGLATTAEIALAFAEDDDVRFTATGVALPTATANPVALAGGDDDTAGIDDAAWQAALDRVANPLLIDSQGITVQVSAGQIGMPGRAEEDAWQALLTHAAERDRTAICDASDIVLDDAGMAALTAEGAAFTELDHDDHGGLFGCWTDYADDGVLGGRRVVPASALAMAAIAHADPGYGTRAWPIGSDGHGHPDGIALRLRNEPDAEQRGQLTDAGVNHGRRFLTGPALYGFRSGARESHLVDLGVQRLGMGIDNDIANGKEQAVGKPIPKALQILATVAEDVLGARYAAGELDGSDPQGIAQPAPQRAYGVDTVTVNTPATGRDRQARIEYWIRPTGVAELVLHRTVIVPIGS